MNFYETGSICREMDLLAKFWYKYSMFLSWAMEKCKKLLFLVLYRIMKEWFNKMN